MLKKFFYNPTLREQIIERLKRKTEESMKTWENKKPDLEKKKKIKELAQVAVFGSWPSQKEGTKQ